LSCETNSQSSISTLFVIIIYYSNTSSTSLVNKSALRLSKYALSTHPLKGIIDLAGLKPFVFGGISLINAIPIISPCLAHLNLLLTKSLLDQTLISPHCSNLGLVTFSSIIVAFHLLALVNL